MSASFQHQKPLLRSASVRSLPSPQHGGLLEPRRATSNVTPRPAEEKSFEPARKR